MAIRGSFPSILFFKKAKAKAKGMSGVVLNIDINSHSLWKQMNSVFRSCNVTAQLAGNPVALYMQPF